VKIAEDRPCGTAFCIAMASSRSRNFITYRIGAKVSCCTIVGIVAQAGDDGGQHEVALAFDRCAAGFDLAARGLGLGDGVEIGRHAVRLLSGPIRLAGSVGSPIFFRPACRPTSLASTSS
jgi:hypothetical protein